MKRYLLLSFLLVCCVACVSSSTSTPPTSSSSSDFVQGAALFVAIVAFILPFYFEYLKPRLDRPKLEIYYDNKSPQCRRLSQESSGTASYYIRLKIINNGKTTAQGCIGRLVEIANEDCTLRPDWDISSLTWSAQPKPEPIYLSPKGDHFYLDVVHTVEGEPLFKLRIDETPRAIKWQFESGHYYLHIAIHADKADPVEQWFRVDWNGKFDEFFMEKTDKPNVHT